MDHTVGAGIGGSVGAGVGASVGAGVGASVGVPTNDTTEKPDAFGTKSSPTPSSWNDPANAATLIENELVSSFFFFTF